MSAKVSLLAALAVIALSTSVARATITYDIQKDLDEYGYLNQLDPGISNGTAACGPTATINSFIYMENHYGLTGLVSANPTDDVNKLAGYMNLNPLNGVTDPNFVIGKQQWIDEYNATNGGSLYMVGQDDNGAGGLTLKIPEWQFIYNELKACEDVEVGFGWTVGGGGHWVTATSFHFVDLNENGIINLNETATLDFIDPWGGTNLVGTLAMADAGYLKLTYSGGAAGAGGSGIIDIVVGESIPEPGSLTLLALGASALFLLHRRRG